MEGGHPGLLRGIGGRGPVEDDAFDVAPRAPHGDLKVDGPGWRWLMKTCLISGILTLT